MEGPGLRLVDNETKAQASRTSKEGKRYTYKLHVIQQPSRARACGSGAKSSADRRPVDPPPIVELKIFEGEGTESEARDVTFSMNSTYFLFATLEQARNVTHGRVPQPDRKELTVLTGTPVAGMVYLDRPNPAGYFIFPDLSVRHEGKYRLAFSLYEQLKDEKDDDQVENDTGKQAAARQEHVTHRLEVKSVPFTVYSAKKFPGLTESTSLSRIVAEQGCRVRIRRDVRMRRRDTKGGKDWDGYEDETAEIRARMSATPEASGYSGFMDSAARPRSSSNASHHSLAPSLSRRPSLQDIGQGYHQPAYGTAPHTPQTAYPVSSPYGAGPSPSEQYSQPPFMQQQSTMQPPAPQYHQQTYQPPPPMPPAPSSQQAFYSYGPAASAPPVAHSHYAAPPPSYESQAHPHRMSVDYSPQEPSDYRRSSTQYGPPPPQPNYASTPSQQPYQSQGNYQQAYHQPSAQPAYAGNPSYQPSYPPSDGYNNRWGPAEPVQPPTRVAGAHTPLSSRPPYSDKLPPLNTTLNRLSNKAIEPSSPVSASSNSQSTYYTSAQGSMDSNKRQFGQVFNDRHLNQPLRQGARPSVSGYGHNSIPGMYTAADDNDEPEPDSSSFGIQRMTYRRADGRRIERNLPPSA